MVVERDAAHAVDNVIIPLGYIGVLLPVAGQLEETVQDQQFGRVLCQGRADYLLAAAK